MFELLDEISSHLWQENDFPRMEDESSIRFLYGAVGSGALIAWIDCVRVIVLSHLETAAYTRSKSDMCAGCRCCASDEESG